MAGVSIENYLHHVDFLLDHSTMSSDQDPIMKKKRTRACLDHLTMEEKQERRKEKNRQAAQTARDRKRFKMDHLEVENCKLREENERLRKALALASQQNSQASTTNRNNNTTTTPDSGVSDVDVSSKASTTSDEDQLIDSLIGIDNELDLTDEVTKVFNFIDSEVSGDDAAFGPAVSINIPPQQVQAVSSQARQASIVNSLGWTSIQIMLIILITRIHHTLSAKINCCQRARTFKSNHRLETILDYITHSECIHYRQAANAVIGESNVREQRNTAIDFVNKYIHTKVS